MTLDEEEGYSTSSPDNLLMTDYQLQNVIRNQSAAIGSAAIGLQQLALLQLSLKQLSLWYLA